MKSYLGQGKTYAQELKEIKKMCIKIYGIGFIFATPKVRAVLIESMQQTIDELVKMIEEKGQETLDYISKKDYFNVRTNKKKSK